MKYCTNCGKKLEENSGFCTECGTKVDNDVKQIQESGTTVYANASFILGILGLLVASIISVYGISRSNDLAYIFLITFISGPLNILAIVFGIVNFLQEKNRLATMGFTMGIIGADISVIVFMAIYII